MKLDPMQRSRDFTTGQHPTRGPKSTQRQLVEANTRLTTAFDAFGGGGGAGSGLVLDGLPEADESYIGKTVVVRTPAGQPAAVYTGGQDAFDGPVWVPQTGADPASWAYQATIDLPGVVIYAIAATPRRLYLLAQSGNVYEYTYDGDLQDTFAPPSFDGARSGLSHDPATNRFGVATTTGIQVYNADFSALVWEQVTTGSGNGEFGGGANSLAVDVSSNWYVTDPLNHRVQKFNSGGTFVTAWGSQGSGDGQFQGLAGIAVDADGNVHVVDINNGRIQKFDNSGTFLLDYALVGGGPSAFVLPPFLTCTDDGNLVITDSDRRRLSICNARGEFITEVPLDKVGAGEWSPSSIADYRGNLFVCDLDLIGGGSKIHRFRAAGATTAAIVVAKNAAIISGAARILDFSEKFLVTENPAGEANIDLDYGTIAVGLNGSLVAADASVLDFSSAFTATESPSGEANIGLATLGPAALGVIGIYQDADYTGSNSNTAQKIFNESANGAANVAASTAYLMQASIYLRTTGTTSHGLDLLFGGTATLTSMGYTGTIGRSLTSGATTSVGEFTGTGASATVVSGAVATATYYFIQFSGIVRVNGAGTFIPQFKFSAAPGVAPVTGHDSYLTLTPIGANTVTTVGSWS